MYVPYDYRSHRCMTNDVSLASFSLQEKQLEELREEAKARTGQGRDWARDGPEKDALVATKLQIAEAHGAALNDGHVKPYKYMQYTHNMMYEIYTIYYIDHIYIFCCFQLLSSLKGYVNRLMMSWRSFGNSSGWVSRAFVRDAPRLNREGLKRQLAELQALDSLHFARSS